MLTCLAHSSHCNTLGPVCRGGICSSVPYWAAKLEGESTFILSRMFSLNSIPQSDINLLEQKRWLVSLTSYICQSLERAHQINIKDVKWGEKEWTRPWETHLPPVSQFPRAFMEGIIRRGSGVWRQHSPGKALQKDKGYLVFTTEGRPSGFHNAWRQLKSDFELSTSNISLRCFWITASL